MSHRFKKNHCISDDESEEDDSISDCSFSDTKSKDNSDYDDSISSENESELSIAGIKSPEASKHSGTEINVSSSDKDDSFRSESSVSVKNSSFEQSDTKKEKDHNANQFKNVLVAKTQNPENPIDCNVEDVLVLESSISTINETKSVINDSLNEISSNSVQVPLKNLNNSSPKIVCESSESDSSVEVIASVVNSSPEVTHSKISVKIGEQSIDGIKNTENLSNINTLNDTSKTSIKSNNSLSLSGISNGNNNSVCIINTSHDEQRALERQLADKRTAYQNILRAIKSCNPNKLKDGGKLLKEKLAKCEEEVEELKQKLSKVAVVSNDEIKKHSTKANVLFSTSDQQTDNLGKIGLQTHRVEAALTVDALVTLHSSLQTCPAEDTLEKDPKGLRVELMPHQKYALSWLLWREKQIPAGGILADDMGLGKTLTMIALVLRSEEYKKEKNLVEDKSPFMNNNVRIYPGKTLVICPSSLLGQWENQIKQHCKSNLLSTLIHHGKPRELQAKKLAAHDIVISSYGVCVEENKFIKENKKGALFRVEWERVIIDEGHVIRNHKTKTAQAICELEAKYRWCLTGTPVQNKELDMYSQLKFLRCSPFDNLAVWKRWVDNKSANGVQRLKTVVKSILLRRTKEELKKLGELEELPAKNSIPVYIKLDDEEQKVYHTVLHFSKNLLAEFILQEQKKLGFVDEELRSQHHKLLHSANEIKTTEIFVLLLRLRQICCLPGLIHSMLEKDSCAADGIDPEDDPILQDLASQMSRMSVGVPSRINEEFEEKKKVLVDSNPVFHINRPSGKIRKVLEIIKESLAAGDKIVIVSQWANLLQKLKTHIVPLDIGVVILDGSVPVKFRPKIIEDFNNERSDVKVMLLSLTAGGVGLNLVGGNRLVIFEPHWNPQLESQACDRIFRVGQKKPVHVYKIICSNTIEEKIELLQQKKLEIADTVLKGELQMNRNKLTLADLKVLFDLQK